MMEVVGSRDRYILPGHRRARAARAALLGSHQLSQDLLRHLRGSQTHLNRRLSLTHRYHLRRRYRHRRIRRIRRM